MSLRVATIQDTERIETNLLSAIADLKKQITEQRSFERLRNKDELAKILNCSSSTIDNLRRRNILRAYYVGGKRGRPMFNVEECLKAIRDRS